MLIVLTALAIFAGMVIPEFESALRDAQRSTTLANLHELTTAIERYKMHHDGEPPVYDATARSLPQLTSGTDELGNLGTGPNYPFGPYLPRGIPENLLSRSKRVFLADQVPPQDLKTRAGWLYDPRTGQIWAGEGRLLRQQLLPRK